MSFPSPHTAPVPAPVGRPRWATVEQTAFLDGRLRKLETEGAGDTLVVYYNRVSRDFLGTWPVEPSTEERNATSDPKQQQELANARRMRVSVVLLVLEGGG